MSLLDAQVPQLLSSQTGFADQAASMRSTISDAEAQAQAAVGYHSGESADAMQAAHARFVEAAQKVNQLLDVAGSQIGEGASTYTGQDAEGASAIGGAIGSLGGGLLGV